MTKNEEREMLEKIRREVEILQDGFPEADIFVNVIYPISGQPGKEKMEVIYVNKKARTERHGQKGKPAGRINRTDGQGENHGETHQSHFTTAGGRNGHDQ